MSHSQKVRLVRKMGGFSSEAWQKRKDAIKERVDKMERTASLNALQRLVSRLRAKGATEAEIKEAVKKVKEPKGAKA